MRDAYQGKLTLVPTMLQAAQAKGLTTAAIGKFGAAFIQDYTRGGFILDEDGRSRSLSPRSCSRPAIRFRRTAAMLTAR